VRPVLFPVVFPGTS